MALSEREIFECMEENMRLAAEACYLLAKGTRGPVYVNLRRYLLLAEGACRQASVWRQDTRWLNLGLKMHEAHDRAGGWLRSRQPQWRFKGLAQILEQGVVRAHSMKVQATKKMGIILPDALPGPMRENRPVQVILPPGFKRAN